MAKQYKIITPDGQTMTVEGPEDATDDELISFAQEQLKTSGSKYAGRQTVVDRPVAQPTISPATQAPVSPETARLQRGQDALSSGILGKVNGVLGGGGIRHLIDNGAMLGLGDEISGLGNAAYNVLSSPFTGHLAPVDAYYGGRDAERAQQDAEREKSPVAGTLAEIAGGFVGLNPTAAIASVPNALAAIRSGAKGGAILGGIAGFGGGRDAETSLTGGVLGGAFGGVLGAAVPVAGLAIQNRVQGLNRLLGKDQPGVARQIVGDALAADANTGASAGAAMDRAHALGVPFMLADTGEGTRGLVAAVGRQPGPSRTTVLNAVQQRQIGQADRIKGAIERDLGPITNGFDQTDAMMARARAQAAPLYDAAYAQPGRTSDELQSLLETPTGRSALSRAYRIAADERRDPATLGLIMDADGNVRLNPAPAAQADDVATARAQLDAAQEAYRAARGSAGGGTTQAALREVESARERLRGAEQALAAAPQEGAEAQAPAFTVQTLDYVKRGIDDVLNDKRNAFGQLQLDEAGRAIEGVRRQFVGEVDRLHPGPYAEARSVYAGPAAARDALETGQQSLNASPNEINRQLGFYGDNERDFYAQGYRNALAGAVDRRVDDADKARALIGTPAKREALGQVFSGEGLDRFSETLAAEQAANQTFRSATQGSGTAERLAYDAEITDPGIEETALDAVLRSVADNPWRAAVTGFQKLRDFDKFGVGEAGKGVRQSIATLLTETDPAELQRILAEANAQAANRVAQDQRTLGGASQVGQRLSGGLVTGASGFGR